MSLNTAKLSPSELAEYVGRLNEAFSDIATFDVNKNIVEMSLSNAIFRKFEIIAPIRNKNK